MKCNNSYQNSEDSKMQEALLATKLEESGYHQAVVIWWDKSFKAFDVIGIKPNWDIKTFELKHTNSEWTFYIFTHWLDKLVWLTTTSADYWVVMTPTKFHFFNTQDLKELLNENNLPFKQNIWIHWKNRWYLIWDKLYKPLILKTINYEN